MDCDAFGGRIEQSPNRNPEKDRQCCAGSIQYKESQRRLEDVVWGQQKENDSGNSQQESENGSYGGCFSIVTKGSHKGK